MLLLPLLLFQVSVPQPKLPPVDTLVPFLGVVSATTTTAFLVHVAKGSATTVAIRAILREPAENQPNQRTNHLEWESVRPATIVVKPGTSKGIVPRQLQPQIPLLPQVYLSSIILMLATLFDFGCKGEICYLSIRTYSKLNPSHVIEMYTVETTN